MVVNLNIAQLGRSAAFIFSVPFTGLHGEFCINAEFQGVGVFAFGFSFSCASCPDTYIYCGKGNFLLYLYQH